MFIKHNHIKSVSLYLIMSMLILLLIGAKSCVNRSDNKIKIGSSNNNTFIINSPSTLTGTAISYSQINLLWQDNSNNEDGFEIWRSINGLTYTLIATLISNENSYSESGLTPYNTYYYRICAFNTVGDRSAYSNEITIVVKLFWIDIAVGTDYSLGITTDGNVWAFGLNDLAQLGLGIGDTINRNTPSLIQIDLDGNPFANVISVIGTDNHSIARKSNGTLWGWGANGSGQLGTGDTDSSDSPFPVTNTIFAGTDRDWSLISTGIGYTIALKTNRTLWGWGSNDQLQLGITDWINRLTPSQIDADSDWSKISCGMLHVLALKTNRTLWGWGANMFGTLGNDDLGYTYPGLVNNDSDWSMISAGRWHSLALKDNGTLWGWGIGINGELGLGDTVGFYINTPTQVGTSSDWLNITGGSYYSMALKTNRTLWGFGTNATYQLGLGDAVSRTAPTQIGFESDWIIVRTGGIDRDYFASIGQVDDTIGHSLGLKSNGSLWVWGYNKYGQLGLGDTINRSTPTVLGE